MSLFKLIRLSEIRNTKYSKAVCHGDVSTTAILASRAGGRSPPFNQI